MSASSRTALELFVAKILIRSTLSEEEQAAIIGLPADVQRAAPNHDIVRPGDVLKHCCLISAGAAGRYAQGRDGGRAITALHLPGDMADLHSFPLPMASTGIQALSHTTVLRVPHAAIRDIIAAHPRLELVFWRECMVDSAILAEWAFNIGRRSALARTAHLFCELACRRTGNTHSQDAEILMDATQSHVADMLGLTSIHLNRMLRKLKESGLIGYDRNTLRVLDWDGLAAAGDFDPRYLQLERVD